MPFRYFFIFLVFFSCNNSIIYKDFESDFENNRWISNKTNEFSFTINEERNCDIVLHLGHIYDFQFASIPLEIKIYYPNRKTEIETIDLKIKDENGKDIAECSGDICDLYYTIKEKVNLEKGDYKVQITNKFNASYLPNILGIGIQVKKEL